MEITITRSTRKGKKYKAVISDLSTKKTLHFGAYGYEDYTQHNDLQRKKNYISRHKQRENWTKSGIYTPGFWSRYLLWEKKTLTESAAYIEKRFNVKINLDVLIK